MTCSSPSRRLLSRFLSAAGPGPDEQPQTTPEAQAQAQAQAQASIFRRTWAPDFGLVLVLVLVLVVAAAVVVVAVLSVELAAVLVLVLVLELELVLVLVAMASALQTFGPDTPLYQPPPASRRVLFIPSCEAASCELWAVGCMRGRLRE